MSPRPTTFIRETEHYWVLAEYPSKSSPGTVHEVRTSKRDGKTYCSCRGWVVALNQLRKKGAKGEAMCCHLKDFKRSKPTEVIEIMDNDSYVNRHLGLILGVRLGQNPDVRRS